MSTRYFVIFVMLIIMVGSGFLVYQQYATGPDTTSQAFVESWLKGDYPEMYSKLSQDSQANVSFVEFKERYEYVRRSAKVESMEVVQRSEASRQGRRATRDFTIKFSSQNVGAWQAEYKIPLVNENILDWKIDWSEDLVLPRLKGEERLEMISEFPTRGEIYDRYGEPLAIEGTAVVVGIEPRRVKDIEDMAGRLNKLLGLTPDFIMAKYNMPGLQPDWFIPLKTLPEDDYARLRPELAPIPGVVFRRVSKRIYPQGESASHLIGYIGEVTEEDMNKWPERHYRSGDLVGRSGLESTMESLLRGELGYKLRSIGPDGRERYVFAEKPMVHGKDVYLTLDMKIQEAAERALGDRSGAIVAVDPLTGELLAVASSPGFDPNLFSFGLSQVEWNLLRNDTRQPLFNKALNGIYPPGSTFKLVTAAAALDSGTVTPETIFEDNGTLMVRGNIIRNFRSESFGEHTFADAVISSINTTFAKVGLELGHDTLTEYAKRFGFEGAPKMELPVNKSSVGDLKVSQTELAWASVGQARVVSTPLQMARVMAVIANEGKALDPSLIYKIVHKTPDGMMGEETYRESGQPIQVLKPETAGVLFSLLGKVVEEGTGKPVTIPGFDVAGKTGTAEIAMGSDVAHAWFVGAAPMDDPKIAFAVFVERGGVGGSVAGPVAKNFLIDVFNIDLSETIVNATSATTSLKSFWERVVGE